MSSSQSRAQDDRPPNFGMVKYTVLGLLCVELVWAIIYAILTGTNTVHDTCTAKKDGSSTTPIYGSTYSPGQAAAFAGAALGLVILLACCCICCLVAEFVVIILENYCAMICFDVLQGLKVLSDFIGIFECNATYVVTLLLSGVTLAMFIWYTIILGRIQASRRAQEGYVMSAPGNQQYQQQSSNAASQAQPGSGALNEA